MQKGQQHILFAVELFTSSIHKKSKIKKNHRIQTEWYTCKKEIHTHTYTKMRPNKNIKKTPKTCVYGNKKQKEKKRKTPKNGK